ncbi:hypothetical protein FE257_005378 [Aspergillus nanangensis]|uniref:Zn(2)-C6 fungal-type domain-containing protein n=1 Tax=Aspergillus nanangensis TaxID=2582783 RepID=A0AAD4CSB1_ASPNN|nr:hypothetical protein FE257_005378 [Aspergillus nanangensis]
MLFHRGRRASRACVWCHQRKVRCDASFRGCPCTRCIQDGQEKCVLREKLPRLGSIFAPNLEENTFYEQAPVPNNPKPSSTATGHVDYSSYPFLELRNLHVLDAEDLSYLTSKGCLNVPAQPALDDFVKQYFLHVHPGTPVVDEASFWHMYLECDNSVLGGDQKLSVFVFQAMLFTSCSYVSEESIRQCGFSDKRAARNSFYNRAKLLLDLKAEDRPLCKTQGAILLSHHVSPDDPQIGSLWLANATQNAVLLGKQPTPLSDHVEDSMKKRIWWSILLRDRILCLGLRRRTQVTSKHFNAEANYFEEADFEDEINYSNVYDRQAKRVLIEVLQQQCRLAVVVTDMVAFIFASYGASSPSLSLRKFQVYQNGISNAKNELLKWEKNFFLLKPVAEGENVPSEATTMIKMTYLYYYTAQLHLAHYEALLLESHAKFAGQTYVDQLCECRTYLKNAVEGLNQTLVHFSERQNIETIPLCLLAFVAMPLIVSALDVKLAHTHDQTLLRRQRLDVLAEIYRRSASLYDVTNFVAVGSNQILQLVYRISHELLAQEEDHSIEDTIGTDMLSPSSSDNTVGTWLDLFLYYPRLYLLLSTSVDYSLSIGRLPHDRALPDVLQLQNQQQQGGGALKIELPWMSTVALLPSPAEQQQGDRDGTFWCPSEPAGGPPLSAIMPQNVEQTMPDRDLDYNNGEPDPTFKDLMPPLDLGILEYINQSGLNNVYGAGSLPYEVAGSGHLDHRDRML